MTPDQIIAQFETAATPPADALRAAVKHADALAPRVTAVAAKLCAGVHLLPRQRLLLLHGLSSLAAARHTCLFDVLMQLVRQPDEDLDQLWPEHASHSLARLLLTVWDGNADALFHLIEHADIAEDSRWALFDVVARLTCEGRIPRDQTAAFLERFEHDAVAGDDDATWWAWEEAVANLGLTELEPAIRRVWTKGINADLASEGREETLARLAAAAAADRGDLSHFEQDGIRPIDDPVEALAWVEQRAAAVEAALTEHLSELRQGELGQGDGGLADDPVLAGLLTVEEITWLDSFLVSRQVPGTTMMLEEVDGLLAAIAVGPAPVPAEEYLPIVWGTERGEGPIWDSDDQRAYFMSLLAKHAAAIAGQRESGGPIMPFIVDFEVEDAGCDWAFGFQAGMELRGPDWNRLLRSSRAAELVMSILVLTGEHDEAQEDELTPEARVEILEDLPEILTEVAGLWRGGSRTPVRSTKVGRNEPCPCGSGAKYKKCCGTTPPPVVH